MKPSQSMLSYWLASVRRMAAGATLEGVQEDAIIEAALAGIREGRAVNGDGR